MYVFIYLWSGKVSTVYLLIQKSPHQIHVDEPSDEVNLPDLVRKRVHMG